MGSRICNAALVAGTIAVVALALALPSAKEPAMASDDRARTAIGELNNDYRPWSAPLWVPDHRTENLLFALQAALGAGTVGYVLGYRRGRRNPAKDRNHA